MQVFKLSGYFAELRQNKYGEFEVFLGYEDSTRFSGVTVTDYKAYKTKKNAFKKIEFAFKSWLGLDEIEAINELLKAS